MPESSRPGSRKVPRFLFYSLLVPIGLLLMMFLSNPLTDILVSRVCGAGLGFPIVLRGVRCKFPVQAGLIFRADEIDLRPFLREPNFSAARFIQKHRLDSLLLVKNPRWVLRSRDGRLTVHLLEASLGEVLAKGGLRVDRGRVSKWNAAFWLPRSLWGRFPEAVEKRFAQDASGRRLFKLTWAGGRCRLWGRSGPVLEAGWQ